MSLESNKEKRIFNRAGKLEEMLNNKIPFDILTEEQREDMFSSFVEFDSVSSDMLAYIAIKTKKKDTLEKALKHPKIIIDWESVIARIDTISKNNSVDIKFIIDILVKQFDEIIQIERGFKLFLDICYIIVNKTYFVEIDKDGYCDGVLNIILNYFEKNLDEESLVKLSKEILFNRWSYLSRFSRSVRNIFYHPQGSIDTSNRAISIMGKLEELCKNNEKINASDREECSVICGDTLFDFIRLLTGGFDSCMSFPHEKNLICNKQQTRDEQGNWIQHYSHTQSFSNALLDVMLRDRNFQWQKDNRRHDTLKLVVDFIYDDNTTEDMIRKVLVDRLDGFCISKEECGKVTIQVDDRIDTLFEAIVTDERFHKKELPYELLRSMIFLSKRDVVFVECYKKCSSEEFEKIILDKVLSGKIHISELNAHRFPKEIMDVFWRGRNKFDKNSTHSIYGVMIGCKNTPRDVLIESLHMLDKSYNFPKSLLPVILNPNFDKNIYASLVSKINQHKSYPFMPEFDVTWLYEDPIGFSKAIMEGKEKTEIWLLECQICEVIFGSAIKYESIKEDSVIQFLSQFDSKEEYIAAYYRLLSFVPSKEKEVPKL